MNSSTDMDDEDGASDVPEQNLQYCTFWLAGRLFGIDIMAVKEIHPTVEFTPIYHSPDQVKGYVNIRGQIYLICDLRVLFGFEDDKRSESCLILFKQEIAEPFGILVDRVGDVADVSPDKIEQRREGSDTRQEGEIGAHLATGVCQLEGSLLVLLNAKSIIKSTEQGIEETNNA